MKKHSLKLSILTTVAVLFSLVTFSQYRDRFTEANLLMEEGAYGLAIPIWRELAREDPNNANIQYKLGRSILERGIDRTQALKHLENAATQIEKRYDPIAHDFKGAPVETYYYLGLTKHLDNDVDEAIELYETFLSEAGDNHILRELATRQIEMAYNAKELMANPVQVTVTKLDNPINSIYVDYGPVASFDENTVYFTSRRPMEGVKDQEVDPFTGLLYENMYVVYRNIYGEWSEPELLNNNTLNEHSSVVGMAPGGDQLFIYRTFNENGNLYKSELVPGQGWTTPELLGSDINSAYGEYSVCLSTDQQTIFFVSDRPGGMGGKDIWYAKKLPNGNWGKAINMGAPINSKYDDESPCLHPDGKTMFFSSKGHKSMGGYDIFVSHAVSENIWSEPKNLGYPINSTDNDVFYVTSPSGERGYYSSNQKGGGSTDLYMVEYDKADSPPAVDLSTFAVLKGWILTPTGEDIPDNMKIKITNTATSEVKGEARPVKRNGSFVFIIPSGGEYRVEYFLDDQIVYSEVVEIPEGLAYKELPRELFLQPSKEDGYEVLANLNEKTLGEEVVRWRVGYTDKDSRVPLGTRVEFLDENGKIIESAYVSSAGFFEFKKIGESKPFILRTVLPDGSDEDLEIVLVDERREMRPIELIPVSNAVFYEKGSEPALAGTNRMESIRKEMEKTSESCTGFTVPVAADKNFNLNFGYNETSIQESSRSFKALVNAIGYEVSQKGNATVSIEASASKVPTKTYGTNERLAKSRAESAKKELIAALKSRNIDVNKVTFATPETKVQGPEYDVNNRKPASEYGKFQYVRILLN